MTETMMAGKKSLAVCSAAFALVCAALVTPRAVQAHNVWLEQTGGKTWLHFGDFDRNLREESPGYLDGFGKPQALRISASGRIPVAVEKTDKGFKVAAQPGSTEALVAFDADYVLRTSEQQGKKTTTWSYHAARLITSTQAQDPVLPLDLTPTGHAGEFRLTFKNQPLTRATVEASAQSGWSFSMRSDAAGLVRFNFPWQGQYVLTVLHVDATPGERNGEHYDIIRYPLGVTWVQPQGLPAVPAPPVTPAYKPQ